MKHNNCNEISMPYEARITAPESNSKCVQIMKSMSKLLSNHQAVFPTFPKTETYRLIPKANRYPGDVADTILAVEAIAIVILSMFAVQLLVGGHW